MAHTKALGSIKLGRDSEAKRLGVKKNHGEPVKPGQILLRQRGTRYIPGDNVLRAGDDTLYSKIEGVVQYSKGKKTRFNSKIRYATWVKVLPKS
ncbi:MAG TPA: 50S ribosomal protein L27 [Candidatus Colwellbacteria bacterium]|nr:50S ribosomal protein L27 [Candidatus Colwellbacteria bacterium]